MTHVYAHGDGAAETGPAITPIKQSKRANDAQEARKLRGHFARFKPLDSSLGDTRLLRQRRLREVLCKSRTSESRAEFAQNGIVGELWGNLHSASH